MSETRPQTREDLLQQLEKLTGRSFRTREDIQAYVREVSARKVADAPSVRRWLQMKRVTLFVLLSFGIMQYYILDVMLEIVSMPATTYFVPARAPLLKSMLERLG
jgi:hypothetical protein